jgi:hypothetical protein
MSGVHSPLTLGDEKSGMMRKLVIIIVLLVFGLASPLLADSLGFGLKVSPKPAVAAFSEWYLSPNLSLALSLGIQTPGITIDVLGKFYLPDNMAAIALYGGLGGRLGVSNSLQTFIGLLVGMKLNLGLNLNLLGELALFSPLADLRRFVLEPYLGVEVRFKF